MKLKLTILALLISLNCFAQTLTLTHQGFLCPAGAHPWISGDVTNSAHKVTSDFYKFTAGIGITLEATNAQDIIVYRSVVDFWNTNHFDSLGNIVPGPPPEGQRYFSPEVILTNPP